MRRITVFTSQHFVIPAQAGIQEGEGGGLNGTQVLSDDMPDYCAPVWSFPPCGNGLSKPLDSSLRWNDGWGQNGFLPIRQLLCYACRIPDPNPIVIPAKAGIQEDEAGMLNG